MTINLNIFDVADLFGITNNFSSWLVLSCEIVLLLGLIYFSSGRIAKEILDVAAKTVGTIAGSTIIYKNTVGGSSSDKDDKKDKKDKKDDNKKNETKNETTSK